MSLKQAYDLYKKVMKFQNGIDKISKGNFTDEDSIKTIITSLNFIFNMSKNKSQYEKNTFKGMQFAFWQTVIEVGGRYAGFSISAEFLQHSLEENPEDLYFALHLVDLKISALKNNDKWKLDIKIHDTYDYSKAKNLIQYYNDTNSIPKSILSSSLYNLAAFSNYFNVIKIYEINIEFTIKDYQQ